MHFILEILRGLVIIAFSPVLLILSFIVFGCKFIYYGWKGVTKENS